MLNFKTFIKTVYRNSRYFYQDFVNGYNVFTDGQIMVLLKKILIMNYVKILLRV